MKFLEGININGSCRAVRFAGKAGHAVIRIGNVRPTSAGQAALGFLKGAEGYPTGARFTRKDARTAMARSSKEFVKPPDLH